MNLSLSQAIDAAMAGKSTRVLCPGHADSDPSLDVSPGDVGVIMRCRSAGCDTKSIMQAAGLPMSALFRENLTLNGNLHPPPKPKSVWEPIDQAPAPATDSDRCHPKHGPPTRFWEYRTPAGATICEICRWDLPGAKKQISQLSWCKNRASGLVRWTWKGPERPKPLYKLDVLAARPNDPVLVVEGEKSADAAQRLLPDWVCISWMGGTAAVDDANWKPLSGRTVVIWPDNDPPGLQAARAISRKLPGSRVIAIPPNTPPKWDLADAESDGWTSDQVRAAIQPPPPVASHAPFRCLGHDNGSFHYLSTASGQIVRLNATEHTELNLQLIASDDHWFATGAILKSGDIDYKAVAKSLFKSQHAVGFYDPDHVRGVGCWLENSGNTVVFHAGDHLLVNGVKTAIHAHSSSFIYPARRPIEADISEPASESDGQRLIDLSNLLPWSHDSWPWVLSAVCFLAPICGALDWRPHLWIVGSKGTGKSYVYTNFTIPLLGGCVIKAQSSTTEAGIRQILQADAMPVIIDEAEAKDERSALRIRGVLELARQSSSETGGAILKGSATGEARQFRIRSCFIFSSIGMGATESADESRISRVEFAKPNGTDSAAKFEALKALMPSTTLNPEFCRRIRARAIRLAPLIRSTAQLFLTAIAKACGDSRKGQQYGTIAAGYWHLIHDTPPTPADAAAWAASIQWNNVGAGDSLLDGDESRALDIILQAKIQVQSQDGTRFDRNVADLISAFLANNQESDAAEAALIRHGIHPMRFCNGISGGAIDIANRHVELDRIFRHTPYAARWKDHLMRLDGAQQSVYTPPGSKTTRATRLPLLSVISPEPPE